MARSGNYQITGNELQGMVDDHLLGLRPGQTIPATNRCLTRAEVASRVFCRVGPQEPPAAAIPFTSWPIGGGVYQMGADPYLTCNYNYLNPLPATNSLQFELNQEGNPYLNVDLFGYVNGSPLRLDPGSNLDGMFFGGPQYSPNVGSSVWVGASIYIQANFGMNYAESPGNYGWNADGYGFVEVYANGALIHDYSVYKPAAFSNNLVEHGYTFTIAANTDYYIKAWSLVTYEYYMCYSSVSPSAACSGVLDNINGDCACCGGYGC